MVEDDDMSAVAETIRGDGTVSILMGVGIQYPVVLRPLENIDQ